MSNPPSKALKSWSPLTLIFHCPYITILSSGQRKTLAILRMLQPHTLLPLYVKLFLPGMFIPALSFWGMDSTQFSRTEALDIAPVSFLGEAKLLWAPGKISHTGNREKLADLGIRHTWLQKSTFATYQLGEHGQFCMSYFSYLQDRPNHSPS